MARRINELFNYLLVLFLITPSPVFADHVPTQPPYNQSIALDSTTGELTIGIYSSDGFEDSPPEKYTIWFDISDSALDTSTSFCISTSFGHGTNLTWQYHVFDLDDLKYYFENPYGTFRTKIRADNDTDNSYSTLTAEQTISIPNQEPFVSSENWTAPSSTCNDTSTTTTTTSSSTTSSTVPITAPNAPTNVSVNYGGEDVYFSWEYEAGEIDVIEFHINYSYDNQTWTRVVIDDTTARTYTLDKSYIQTGTFYWEIASCGDLENNQSCANGDSNNFETTEYVPPTTTTLPPAPKPEPEPEPPPTTTTTLYVVINEDGSESNYTKEEVEDGTVERDSERKANEDKWGCYITDIALLRGDCPAYNDSLVEDKEEEIIIEIDEEEPDTERELPKDDDVVSDVVDKDEDKDTEPIKEDEFVKEEIEIDIEQIEEEFEVEIEIIELPEIIIIEEEILDEEEIEEPIKEDEEPIEEVFEDDEVVDTIPDRQEEVGGRDNEEPVEELSEEEIQEEVAELEEVIEEIIVLDIPEISEEELEELSEEELIEYEEAKEEAIEEYVEELETEEVVEILEEVNDVGVENLESASQEVIEVVAKVVEEVIQIASEEVLTDEQAEVVGEVLGFDEETAKEDVEIIAEAVKEDEVVAEAVEVFVERAVENADSTALPYTLADVVVEIQFEEFVADPIGAIIDIDLQDIKISEIGADLTTDQKEKAQEVIVPTLLLRVASLAFTRRDL